MFTLELGHVSKSSIARGRERAKKVPEKGGGSTKGTEGQSG